MKKNLFFVVIKQKKWYNNNGEKMIKKVNGISLHYIDYGNPDGETLVFLHGWGQNIEMMKMIADPFEKEYHIIIPDLPGFGESSEPETDWTLFEYVDCIHTLLESLKIEEPILLGHSFGGKISLLYATEYPVKKLVLFGSPYKKEVEKTTMKLKVLKSLKKVPVLKQFEEIAKKHIGSTDYKNATPMMRKIMVNHVNLDLSEKIKKIEAPTLLVWGDLDQEVSLEQAYEIEQKIKDAGVVVFEGCTHYAYLENLKGTIRVLRNFL